MSSLNRHVMHAARLATSLLCLASLWPMVVYSGSLTASKSGSIWSSATETSGLGAEEVYRLGKKALAADRYQESIHLLERAVSQGLHGVELHYWLGVAYWNREQGEEAILAYRRAVEHDPEGASPWSLYALENLAEVLTRTDHLAESKEAYRQALAREMRPEWIVTIRNQLAELDLALGLYLPVEQTVFNERGEIIGGVGPGLMHTNRNFEIARHTNDPAKEETYYRLAIQTDPEMYQPYFNLGLALVHQGRHRGAIAWLEKSDTVWKADSVANPGRVDKADAHAFLALCHLQLGDHERAAHHARRALATSESNFWGLLYAQRVKIALGQAAEALPTLESLAIENPEHGEVLYTLSLAYAALDQAENARETLGAAIKSIPENHPWMVLLRTEWEGSLR